MCDDIIIFQTESLLSKMVNTQVAEQQSDWGIGRGEGRGGQREVGGWGGRVGGW